MMKHKSKYTIDGPKMEKNPPLIIKAAVFDLTG